MPNPSIANEDVESWWDLRSDKSKKVISDLAKLSTANRNRWNASDWERVLNYYAIVVLGSPNGYERSRNV